MAGLSGLDRMLGVEPIVSIEDFKSQDARELAAKFGLTLAEIPGLRKALNDHIDWLDQWVASKTFLREYAAKMLAAEAMFFYERAARGKDFKLVIPEQTSISDELYDHTTGVNPNAAPADTNFGKLFAKKAIEYFS